jgi:hypothetical protein
MLNSISDVASFAETLGYDYNSVLSMMERDSIIPFYEQKTLDIYKGIGNAYGWSDELCTIFDAYVEKNGNQVLTE